MVFSVSHWVWGWHCGHAPLVFRRKTGCWHSSFFVLGHHVELQGSVSPAIRSHCMFSLWSWHRVFNILIINIFSLLNPERVCMRWGELVVPATGREPFRCVASEPKVRPTSVLVGFQSSRDQWVERFEWSVPRYIAVSSGLCGTWFAGV
jgi:hypothetical protein